MKITKKTLLSEKNIIIDTVSTVKEAEKGNFISRKELKKRMNG